MNGPSAKAKFGGLIQWALPVAIISGWEAASLAGLIPLRVLPAPTDVATAGWKLIRNGELFNNIWVSFWRALVGFAIGGGIGFAFGLANGLSDLSEQVFDSTLQMVRNIPHLAMIPLVILWFGIDETAKIFLVALGVFFPIYINTQHGIRTVDPQLIEMGRSYGTVPARDPAGGAAVDLRRPALRSGHHVADAHRRRNDRGVVRHRLHGDAGPRIPVGRCRRAQHRDLRAPGQASRQHRPPPGAAVPALAPGVSGMTGSTKGIIVVSSLAKARVKKVSASS